VASTALFFATLGWFLAGSLYSKAYTTATGMTNRARKPGSSLLERLFAPLIRWKPQSGALMLKDVKTFCRDPAQWAQVLIFFGLLMVYSGNLRNLQAPIDQPFYKNLISFLNLGASSMTLSTLCSRFIFPMISLEGQRFWILGLAPVRRRQILWTKFWFAFGGAVMLGIPVTVISNFMLNSVPMVFAVQLLTSVLIAAGLSGLSVGMGALFPNFHERNPSKIVSGFGGTLTLILSVGLVAFSVGGGAFLSHHFLVVPELNGGIARTENNWIWAGPFILALTVFNLLAAWVPMKLGARALEKVEF
jgi:ABC-2 type transport system permease protein